MQTTYGSCVGRAGLVGLLAALVLCLWPATGLAAGGAAQARPVLVAVAQAKSVPLARWAGYWTPSTAGQRTEGIDRRRVRALQRLLRRLGKRPGPVDGLFGPLTEAGVVRFQRSAGIAADGVVGRQTARRLLAATGWSSTRLARQPGGDARRSAQFASARVAQAGAFALARATGLGASVSPAAATDQEEEFDPGLMLALAVPLLLASALLGALRGRATPATSTPNATINRSVVVPAPVQRRPPMTAGHTGNHNPPAEPEQRQTLRAIGYVSGGPFESLDESGPNNQMTAIEAACSERGWELLEIVRDVERTGVGAPDRPGLARALRRMQDGDASCMVIHSLPRLSPAVTELGSILKAIGRTGARFVSLDDQIDTAEPAGRKAANVIAIVSGWEHERLGERTRQGLAAARANGSSISRPSVQDVPLLKERIAEMRAEGMTLQAIANWLNDSGVPTLRGGQRWRPSSVQAAAGYRRPKR